MSISVGRRIQSKRYGMLFVLLGLLCLPGAALAQSYGCGSACLPPPPPTPGKPSVSENPSSDGNYYVTGNAQYGSFAEVSGAGDFGNDSIYVSGKSNGQYTYYAKACFYHNGYKVCSGWSSGRTVTVVRTPGNKPGIEDVSAGECQDSWVVDWSSGGSTPSGTTRYYHLQHSVDGGSWSTISSSLTSSHRSRSISESTSYRYRVRSRDKYEGHYSSWTGFDYTDTENVPDCRPGDPDSFAVSIAGTTADLSWNAPTGEPSVDRYRIQRRDRSRDGGNWSGWGENREWTTSSLNSEDSNLKRGWEYRYRVRAEEDDGDYSDYVTAPDSVKVDYPPPEVPNSPVDFENISLDTPVEGSYDIVWQSAVGNVNEYRLHESTDGGIDWTRIYTGAATRETADPRTFGVHYLYKVEACNIDDVCREYPGHNTMFIPRTPGDPVFGGIEDYGRDYTVSWTGSGEPDVAYTLYYREGTDGDWETPGDVGMSHPLNNLNKGSLYQHKVRACKDGICGRYTPVIEYHVPDEPELLASADDDGTSPTLTVSWSGGADHYKVWEKIGGADWVELSEADIVNDEYSPDPVNRGVTYAYKAKACNEQNACSAYSDEVQEYFDRPAPGSTTNVTAALNEAGDRIDVNWDAADGYVDDYEIEYSTVEDPETTGSGTVTGRTFSLSELTHGLTYRFRVAACNADSGCGQAGVSNDVVLRPPMPKLEAGGRTPEQDDDDGIPTYTVGWKAEYTLEWGRVQGAATNVTAYEQNAGNGDWVELAPDDSLSDPAGLSYALKFEQPANEGSGPKTYNYRARACNEETDGDTDNCSAWKQIDVKVDEYPKPGVVEDFRISAGPSEAGAYTLQWHRPDGTADLHYYQLDRFHEGDPPDEPGFENIQHVCDRDANELCLENPAYDPDNPDAQPFFKNEIVTYERSFDNGEPGETYSYRVRACFGAQTGINAEIGCSAYIEPLDVYIPYAAPDTPANPTHTEPDADGVYRLQWDAPDGRVDYYRVQRLDTTTPAEDDWVDVGTSEAAEPGAAPPAEFEVGDHPRGETRTYRVRACNADECGDYTGAPYTQVYVPYLEPDEPGQLYWDSLDAAERSIMLKWGQADGHVEHYELQISTDNTNWDDLVTTAATRFTAGDLAGGNRYYFRIRACNRDACNADTPTPYSDSIDVRLPYPAPGTPGGVSHNADTDMDPVTGALTVRWSAPDNGRVTYYRLQYSIDGGDVWTALSLPQSESERTPGTAPTDHPFTGLDTGLAYTLRVKACNEDHCSPWANPYQAYLPHPAPAAPASLQVEEMDAVQRQYKLVWGTGEGIVSRYELEQDDGADGGWRPVALDLTDLYRWMNDRIAGESDSYRLRACNKDRCSDYVESGPVRMPYLTPEAPTGLVVQDVTFDEDDKGSYTLWWNGVVGPATHHYFLERSSTGTGGWQRVNADTPHRLSYDVSGKPAGSVHYYRVKACNPPPQETDCSAYTTPAERVGVPLPQTAPPAGLDYAPGYVLEWTPGDPDNAEYHLQHQDDTSADNGWNDIGYALSGTSQSFAPGCGNSHRFRVRGRASENGQHGAWSDWHTSDIIDVPACTITEDGGTAETGAVSLTAPSFTPTGQYEVVYSAYTGVPVTTGNTYHRIRFTENTAVIEDTGAQDVPQNIGGTLDYRGAAGRATGYYDYRIYAIGFDGQKEATRIVTVLRKPGNVGGITVLDDAGVYVDPDPIDNAYPLSDRNFTLQWQPVSADSTASVVYELQRRRNHTDQWQQLDSVSGTSASLSLPASGSVYQYRVRACTVYQHYDNCSAYSTHAVKHSLGMPRFVNDIPPDDEIVIYDKEVPVQWLPPEGMAAAGDIHHYEVWLRRIHKDESGGTVESDRELVSSTQPNTDGSPPYHQSSEIKVNDGGQKRFMIRACGDADHGSCGESLTFDITVIVPPDPPRAPDQMIGQSDPDPSDAGAFNGVLKGQLAVQPSGAAGYTVPVTVPPGTAGVEPKVSLAYNSLGGNGVAGWGWTLNATSVIRRCNKTRVQDGEVDTVDYNSQDAFCLDGQRLIEIDDNEYRTEINDFRRITRISGGTCGTWFEVKTQAGDTRQYGNTGNACIEAEVNNDTQVTAWVMNRVTDTVGNYMTYDYIDDQANNAFVLDRIEYTGNGAQLPYTMVDFTYDDARPDPIDVFNAGFESVQTRRLTGITTDAGTYHLNYHDNEGNDPTSRLERIEYCSVDGTCMEPLEFEWSRVAGGWTPLPTRYEPPHPFIRGEEGHDAGARIVDLDADGLPDLVYASPDVHATYRNTGNGWEAWPEAELPARFDFVDEDGKDQGLRLVDLNGDARPELVTTEETVYDVCDTDCGEPRYDVYRFHGQVWARAASLSLPVSFLTEDGKDNGVRLGDLNGDGLTDIVQAYDGSRRVWLNLPDDPDRWVRNYGGVPVDFVEPIGGEMMANGSQLVDLNGDGLSDIFSAHPGDQPDVYLRQNSGVWLGDNDYFAGTSNLVYECKIPSDPLVERICDGGIRLADVNGDGLPDMVRGTEHYSRLWWNTGKGWRKEEQFGGFDVSHGPQFFDLMKAQRMNGGLMDVNADGRADAINGEKVALTTASGWRPDDNYRLPIAHLDRQGGDNGTRFIDLNGDGRADLLQGAQYKSSAWAARTGWRQITAIHGGLGNTTDIRYKALTDPRLDGRETPIYKPLEGEVDPPHSLETRTPLSVVDRVAVPDGIGGRKTTEYTWQGKISRTGGRGQPGVFEKMTVRAPDNTLTTTHYHLAYPYAGRVKSSEVRYVDGGTDLLLSRSENQYCYAITGDDDPAADPENAAFTSIAADQPCPAYDDWAQTRESLYVYMQRTKGTEHRINDAVTARVDSVETETRNTYGAYGYTTESVVETRDDTDTYKTTTSSQYRPDALWEGRLSRTTVTNLKNGTGDAKQTRTTAFEYDPDTLLLTKEIVEPDKAAPLKLVTVYAHDDYGNVVEKTVCAENFDSCMADPYGANADALGRSTTTEYDDNGRFPVKTINALDQSETRAFEHPLGLKTRQTGPNGITTEWTYDGLGRKRSRTSLVGTDDEHRTSWEYRETGTGFLPDAVYFVEKNPPASGISRVYYDAQGRERRTLTRTMHGEWVATDTQYDRHGRVKRASEPYFVYGRNGADVPWKGTDFDALGRVQETRVPTGDRRGGPAPEPDAVSRIDYEGASTVTIDAKGRKRRETVNAVGRTVKVVDDVEGKGVKLSYTYDSQGNLETTTVNDDPDTTVTVHHDLRGRKTSMDDPDMGSWAYQYNGYGELRLQTDAKGQVTDIDYDKLGRMIRRTEQGDRDNDGQLESARESTWKYDTAPGAGIGKLHYMKGPAGTSRCHTYNDLGRRIATETAMGDCSKQGYDGESYTIQRNYDVYGRVKRTIYPRVGGDSFFVTENAYSPFGGLWYVLDARDPTDADVLWIAEMVNQRGQIMRRILRNQTSVNTLYNRATGWVQKIETWDEYETTIQRERYEYDVAGNLDFRHRFRPWILDSYGDFTRSTEEEIKESFEYDSLDRLTSAELERNKEPESSQSYDYDDLGNLTEKAGVSYSYTGCTAGPHAVCNANGSTYQYDANGNMTGGAGRTVEYSAFNKPVQISEGGQTVEFVYGADRRRVVKHAGDGTSSETTRYVGIGDGGALYEKTSRTDENGDTAHEHRHYLYAGGQPFGVFVQRETDDANPDQPNAVGPGRFSYFHRDRLGSVTAVTDELGRVEGLEGEPGVELAGYDPWGKRRNPDWSDSGEVDQYTKDSIGRRGFTGHESVAEVGLVHMNGRVYDPELGRFLSADPHIQFSGDTQSYNRYSYVQNNPLRYTDPSGYFLKEWTRGMFRMMGQETSGVVIGVVSSACGYAASVCAAGLTYQSTRAFGGSSQQASQAAGRAMFTTMFTAVTAQAIGNYFEGASHSNLAEQAWRQQEGLPALKLYNFGGNQLTVSQISAQITLHGLVGGIAAGANGDDFESGFLSGALTKSVSPQIESLTGGSFVAGTVTASIVGGTISELTGGKFANGARTAALAYALNELGGRSNQGESNDRAIVDHHFGDKGPGTTAGYWSGNTQNPTSMTDAEVIAVLSLYPAAKSASAAVSAFRALPPNVKRALKAKAMQLIIENANWPYQPARPTGDGSPGNPHRPPNPENPNPVVQPK